MKTTKYFFLAIMLWMVSACEIGGLIEEKPKGFINDLSLFETEAGAQAALVGCYEAISTYYYFGVAYTQLLSLGSGAFWTSHTASLPVARQTAQPTDALVNNVWRTTYSAINTVNGLISNL